MNIFNSLGSNYNFKFVIRHLLSRNDVNKQLKLKNLLEDKYGGEVTFVYKGREAIRLALRATNLEEATVAFCGFTCFAVYEAIAGEGFSTSYIDIEKNEINFTVENLEKEYIKNPKIKILLVQNTLGFPCDIERIAKYCKEKNIILIEDLAHSIGAKYKNGLEAGTVGDFTILSFSQDKMIDGVAGGALITRNSKFRIQNSELQKVSSSQQWKDRLYPLFTFKIRNTYGLGIGKALHFLLKNTNLLSKPVDNSESHKLHKLPYWYTQSILREFNSMGANLIHRKTIAEIYAECLDNTITSEIICKQIEFSSNLRFPIFVKNRQSLVQFLKKQNIYISDIWYDAPIAPKKYLQKSNYKIGDCPNAEKTSDNILNLPTHKNVSSKDAKYIAERINLWLKSQ